MTTDEITDLLASHATIGKAPREELAWIARHGTLRHYEQGEMVSDQAQIVQGLFILLTGKIAIYMKRGTGVRRMMEWGAGDLTGVLPYSRLTTPPGDVIVEEPTDAIMIHRDVLPQLTLNCYQATALMVHVMTDRARRFTSTDLRDEKMNSLGKLAAGFAHEVNNPASAALRDARALPAVLSASEEAARILFTIGLSKTELAAVDAFCAITRSQTAQPPVSGLALADREDELSAWLSTHGLPEALAGELAPTAASTSDLDRLATTVSGAKLEAALHWAAAACSARSLTTDIERAAHRIHTLVAAAKGFTHMDKSPDLEFFDITPGLSDTVALLNGRARAKSVALSLNIPEELPPIRGYAVEINQIWMNLMDNAIDAAPEGGHVDVTAVIEGPDVIVTVVDDGPGIPQDIREQIFDPFFTTKPVGEGTGLGLDIVHRVVSAHNGDITLNTRPGHTEFRIRLPIGGAG